MAASRVTWTEFCIKNTFNLLVVAHPVGVIIDTLTSNLCQDLWAEVLKNLSVKMSISLPNGLYL